VIIGKIETIVSDGDLRADVIANLVTGSIVAGGGQGPGVIQATKLNGSVTFGGPLNRVVSTGAGAEVLGQISANAFGTTGSDLTSLDAKVLKANAAITTDVRSPIEIREQWEGETRRISIGRSLSERTDPTDALPVGNRMIILHDTDTSTVKPATRSPTKSSSTRTTTRPRRTSMATASSTPPTSGAAMCRSTSPAKAISDPIASPRPSTKP
jgi:hypothetical protein